MFLDLKSTNFTLINYTVIYANSLLYGVKDPVLYLLFLHVFISLHIFQYKN